MTPEIIYNESWPDYLARLLMNPSTLKSGATVAAPATASD